MIGKEGGKKLKYKLFNYANFEAGINTDIDENIIPMNVSTNSYNFSYKNGALTTGMGVGDLKIRYDLTDEEKIRGIRYPEDVELLTIWNYENYFSETETLSRWLIFYGSDKRIYMHYMYINSGTILPLSSTLQVESVPKFMFYRINGDPYYIFITKDAGMQAYNMRNQALRTITNIPTINSYCIHNNRLYVTDVDHKNQVWYSHEDDPTNWAINSDDSGSIEFKDRRGNCLKVVAFEDYVYVFREYGISKITAHKQQSEPQTENMFLSSNSIKGDTVCVCGDKILFMTTDGLYSFNGNTVSKIEVKVESLLRKITKYLCAEYHNNAYYLACKINFDDNNLIGCEKNGDYTTNALLKFDLTTNELSILRGVDITFMNAIKEINQNFLAIVIKENDVHKIGVIDESGKVFNNNLAKYWKSGCWDFDMPNKKKLFKKFYINCEKDATITFIVDGQKYAYEILGSEDTITLSPNLRGYNLSVEISASDPETKISAPKIMVGYL